MTLKVTIQPTTTGANVGDRYPVFYATEGGVTVGAAGELMLVADTSNGLPIEFRIYAPGTWREINVEQTND